MDNTFGFVGSLTLNLLMLAFLILILTSMWKISVKAGRKGWEGIIPLYNLYTVVVIAEKPMWWIILLFIPYVNIVFSVMVWYSISKHFGKDGWFTVGIFFLPFIFLPILAFDSSITYKKLTPTSETGATPTPTVTA